MRHLVLSVLLFTVSGAQASSIVPLTGRSLDASTSMLKKACTECAAPPKVEPQGGYKVPVLSEAVQSVTVMEIDGEKKIVRTEAWMGGSPVVYISKLPEWMTSERVQAAVQSAGSGSVEAAVQVEVPPQDTVDFDARTGALASVALLPSPAQPDFSGYTLRP